MRATWTFRAVRHGCTSRETRRTIRQGERERILRGTERDALEFARRACGYLRPKGVDAVEAWSAGPLDGEPEELPGLVRFSLTPHRNGRDWITEPNQLHHGGWWTDLLQAVDYALFRGSGKLCAVEIKNANSLIQTIVLVDRTGHDACPTRPTSTIALSSVPSVLRSPLQC